MAKKTRTPPPPRRVQSPRRRQDERTPEDRRKLLLLVAFGALGLLALGAVVALLALTSGGGGDEGDSASVASAMRAAGCTYTTAKAKPFESDSMHVPAPDTKVTWNTYPPAAGPHFGATAIWGFYEEPVDPINIIHNAEHGGVILWWGPDTPQAEVDKLRAFYNASPESMLGTPVETIGGKSLGSKVAITAWTGELQTYGRNGEWGTGHVAVCERFDEDAFETFRDELRGKGPEGVPVSQNQPGT